MRPLSFGFAAVLMLVIAGCADEAPPAPPGGGGSGGIIRPPPTGGSGGSTGGTGGLGGGGGAAGGAGIGGGGGTGGVVTTGACDNAGDFAALSTFGTGSPRTLAASVALSQCPDQISSRDGFVSCVAREFAGSLTQSLSTECATCYGELAWCSIPNSCNVACQNNACLTGCLSCSGYDVCVQALNDCTGNVPQECQQT